MSDYHILDNRPDGNNLLVVFHLPVPDSLNAVGINYRTALTQYLDEQTASILPVALLGPGEQTALDTGELYEHVWRFSTHPGESLVDKQDALDSRFAAFSVGIINALHARLEFWGYGRDVP